MLPQQGRMEGTRRSQPVDAQGVVPAVVARPLAVVDDARRKGVQGKVRHAVGADDHAAPLGVEGIDQGLERVLVAVQVVAVELDGKLPASRMEDAGVPATTDTQVVPLRDEMHDARVVGIPPDDLRGAVGGVVVDDDEVEGERGLLPQHRTDGILDGTDSVPDRDDDRCLDGEGCRMQVDFLPVVWLQPGTELLQVVGADAFHLQLYGAVPGVHVVELFLARTAVVRLHFRIQEFIQVNDALRPLCRQPQPEVVQSGIRAVRHFSLETTPEVVAVDQPQGAEVKVVAQAAPLVVDGGVGRPCAVSLHLVTVGVDQSGSRLSCHLQQTFQGMEAQLHCHRTSAEEQVFGIPGRLSQLFQSVGGNKRRPRQERTSGRSFR